MLVNFTDADGREVWINPLQVRTVTTGTKGRRNPFQHQQSHYTVITLASASVGPDGHPSSEPEVWVTLPIEQVVDMLDAATPGGPT
jgi:hypothetical protein